MVSNFFTKAPHIQRVPSVCKSKKRIIAACPKVLSPWLYFNVRWWLHFPGTLDPDQYCDFILPEVAPGIWQAVGQAFNVNPPHAFTAATFARFVLFQPDCFSYFETYLSYYAVPPPNPGWIKAQTYTGGTPFYYTENRQPCNNPQADTEIEINGHS